MKITDLEVDGYGVWSGLRIEKLSDALNVLYGPNEAGKTTLLQFIRSMLYGFSPPRRRYLPPVHGAVISDVQAMQNVPHKTQRGKGREEELGFHWIYLAIFAPWRLWRQNSWDLFWHARIEGRERVASDGDDVGVVMRVWQRTCRSGGQSACRRAVRCRWKTCAGRRGFGRIGLR